MILAAPTRLMNDLPLQSVGRRFCPGSVPHETRRQPPFHVAGSPTQLAYGNGLPATARARPSHQEFHQL